MTLQLVSINIERDLHLDLVLPFLRKQAPDVLCIQELREADIPRFMEAVGENHIYAPTLRHRSDYEAPIGVGIFSKHELKKAASHYYVGDPTEVPREELPAKTGNHALVTADVEIGGQAFTLATTHFVWTPRDKRTTGSAMR